MTTETPTLSPFSAVLSKLMDFITVEGRVIFSFAGTIAQPLLIETDELAVVVMVTEEIQDVIDTT